MPDSLTIATYVALVVSILGLWISRTVWFGALSVAIVLGYVSGVLTNAWALIGIAALEGVCLAYDILKKNASALPFRIAAAAGIAVVSIALAMHVWPGFNNFRVAHEVVLTPLSAPYTLYLNFDKALVGILILGVVYRPLMRSAAQWKAALKGAAPIIVLNIVVLIALAIPLGYLRFDPKFPALFWIWAPVNLLFVCIAEEAFFRGFIQRELSRWPGLAISASALLFGLAHFAGGWNYVFLATVAGAGYAWVFQRTQRIEMSILAHFALNTTHFLLLTYPLAA